MEEFFLCVNLYLQITKNYLKWTTATLWFLEQPGLVENVPAHGRGLHFSSADEMLLSQIPGPAKAPQGSNLSLCFSVGQVKKEAGKMPISA